MEKKQNEQVIYLKDLLFSALYKWKTIVIWSLALALVLGLGKGALSFLNMRNLDLQENNAQQQKLQQDVYEAKKAALQQQIDANHENAQQQQKYLDESVLMNLDPYNLYEIYLSIYVDTNYQILPNMDYQNPDLTNAIIHSYIEFICNTDSTPALAEIVSTKPEYMPELLSVETPYDTQTMAFRIKAQDETTANQLLQFLIDRIQEARTDIAKIVGAHELHVKEQYVRFTLDADLAQKQQEQINKLNDLNDSITNLQTTKNELRAPTALVVSYTTVIKDVVLFAIIGGILGAFLICMYAWVVHISTSKVYSAKTLTNHTGLQVLGCVGISPQKNKLDRKLAVLEGRNTIDAEKQCALLACSIGALCGNVQRLMITGQTTSADRDILANALRQAMPNVQILDDGNLLEDLSARKALDPATPILLIEQCGTSSYAGIEQSVEIATSHGAPIIGCVLLDG